MGTTVCLFPCLAFFNFTRGLARSFFFGITHALNLYLSVGMVMATLQFICYLWLEYVMLLAVRSIMHHAAKLETYFSVVVGHALH